MIYTIPTEVARAATRPTPLVDALRSLRDAGVIKSFTIVGGNLQVEADSGVELSFAVESEIAERSRPIGTLRTPAVYGGGRSRYSHDMVTAIDFGRLNVDTTAAYYRQAEAFTFSREFRQLSKHRRNVWRLHAKGQTNREIADELGCPSGSVARAILTIRPRAGLRRTSRAIPRGRQNRSNS